MGTPEKRSPSPTVPILRSLKILPPLPPQHPLEVSILQLAVDQSSLQKQVTNGGELNPPSDKHALGSHLRCLSQLMS